MFLCQMKSPFNFVIAQSQTHESHADWDQLSVEWNKIEHRVQNGFPEKKCYGHSLKQPTQNAEFSGFLC